MKKLFSVLLVLALCGMASAAVDIYITDSAGNSEIGPAGITPSTYLELYIWYAGDQIIQQFDIEATVRRPPGEGTILGGTITAGNRMTDYDAHVMPGINGGDIEVAGGRDDNGAVLTGRNPPLAIIEFHCDDPTDVYIDLADVMTFDTAWTQILPTYHGMIIHQPEPATIALLCLGGLLLRKK